MLFKICVSLLVKLNIYECLLAISICFSINCYHILSYYIISYSLPIFYFFFNKTKKV